MVQGSAQQNPGTISPECEQPGKGIVQRNSPSKDISGVSISGEIIVVSELEADQSVPISQSAAERIPLLPDIAAFKDDTNSLNAAAEQLLAVCKQLLQGVATPDDLESSLDRPLHCADVRQYSSGRDVLAGLVSDLEFEMTSV